jgi:hypothetical protein
VQQNRTFLDEERFSRTESDVLEKDCDLSVSESDGRVDGLSNDFDRAADSEISGFIAELYSCVGYLNRTQT